VPDSQTRTPRLEPVQLLIAGFAVSSPAAIVLTALVLIDLLTASAAAAAAGVALLIGLIIARWHLRGLLALRTYADRLLTSDEPPPLETRRFGPVLELSSAVVRLHRQNRDALEEARRLAEARSQVLDGVFNPLLLLDGETRIVGANDAARRLFGRELRGRSLAQVLRDPDLLDGVEASLREREGRTVGLTLTTPVACYFMAGLQPLTRPAPDGTALIVSLHDVTDLRRAEQMRADFAANASHEIRTPLAALIGFIETLRGPAKGDIEAADRFLEIMQDQAQRMARLVEDLLSLARIEVNEHQAPTGRVDLGRLVERVAATFELQAARRKIKIQVEVEANLPLVLGEPDELTQLFQNLIDNALKYGRPGGAVRVALRQVERLPAQFLSGSASGAQERAVQVEVRDEGEGIAREHLSRLTERFYRVDPARSRSAGGTGLGLAIVKHIVSRHRGALTIESEMGVGSVFTVHLRIAPAGESELPRRHQNVM
jgi:two-component system phosphate regulon sensor histidine kinase PhoR